MIPYITVAVSVGALLLGAWTARRQQLNEGKKADAAMLDTLSESLTNEIKRCNQDCRDLRVENQQLRSDLADANRREEILRAELKELRILLESGKG